MSSITWTPRAVASEARSWQGCVWRVMEAQHIASTMKLVDDAGEQDVLEALLESSKPALPEASQVLHYLLQAPFRYPPPPGGSRFRGPNDSGVFYGAELSHGLRRGGLLALAFSPGCGKSRSAAPGRAYGVQIGRRWANG